MSKEFDIDLLKKALDNDDNASLMNLDHSRIKTIKNDIFQKLHFKPSHTKELLKKLKEYRFVDDLKDIHYGSYIRWINMNNPEDLKLTNGGIVCDIKVTDIVLIVCKNRFNRYFTIRMDECLIFQKLNNSENIILYAMDHLNK